MSGIAQQILGNPDKYSVAQLKQGVQDGIIPGYIGIPLIQEKMKREKQMQAMMAGPQQQQPPIAEQVMTEAAQTQGVDNLRSNLPQQYAGGGIVAFADNQNQPVSLNMPDKYETPYDRMNRLNRERGIQFGMNAPTDPQAQADREAMADTLRRMGAAGMDIATLPGRGILGALETGVTRPLRALGLPIPYLPESVYGGNRESMTPYYDKLSDKNAAAQPTSATPAATPAATATPPAAQTAPPAGGGISQLLGGLGLGGASVQGRSPGLGVKPQTEFTPPPGKSMAAQTMELMGGYEGADGYAERAAARDKQAENAIAEARKGIQGKAYEGYQKTLEDEAKSFGADKADARAMAIFKAGLAMMAGTSQHGLVNIGAGAMVGAEDYQAAAKDIKKAEKENRKEMSLIEQARRAEAIGDRDKAIEYIEKSNVRKDARDMHITDALSKGLGIDHAQAFDMAKTRYTTQADLERTNLAGQYQLGAADITSKAHLAGSILGAMAKDPAVAMQQKRLELEFNKQNPIDDTRAMMAKQLKLSKVPAAGADASFDQAVNAMHARRFNDFMYGSSAGGAAQNPYAGYKIVP